MDGNHGRRASRDITRYELVVCGELSEHFAPELEGMSLKAKNGRTALVGEIIAVFQAPSLPDALMVLFIVGPLGR
jgi:hypothetical protein